MEQDDCHRFANLVQGLADAANSVDDFLDALARTFTGADNSSTSEMSRNAGRDITNLPGRQVFGPSNGPNGGFKPQFRDASNQARHFVGGFIAVSRLAFPGYLGMQWRENSQGSDDAADIKLNGVSAALASQFILEPLTPALSLTLIRDHLAEAIRREACE
jgi:hypothetical protein